MAQLFSPHVNWIMRSVLVGAPLVVLMTLVIAEAVDTSGYVNRQFLSVDQPVPFSHAHHVGQLQIDCRYCHTQVERFAIAGIPSTEICMTCHSQIWKTSPVLKPVHDSANTGQPLAWMKVTTLPEFVYFNHSIHIQKGVGCVSCHGEVEKMNLTELQHPMTMEFCLNCHRSPAKYLRSPHLVFVSGDEKANLSESEIAMLENKLMHDYNVSPKTDCTTCHR